MHYIHLLRLYVPDIQHLDQNNPSHSKLLRRENIIIKDMLIEGKINYSPNISMPSLEYIGLKKPSTN